MKTLTIEVIDEQALDLLKNMEGLKLIKLKPQKNPAARRQWAKYKGALSKQSLEEIDSQLTELRNGWE